MRALAFDVFGGICFIVFLISLFESKSSVHEIFAVLMFVAAVLCVGFSSILREISQKKSVNQNPENS